MVLCNVFCFVQEFFILIYFSRASLLSRKESKVIYIKTRLWRGCCWFGCVHFDAVSAETVHRLCNDRVMPVFTPGSNTRRLPTAVVTERVVKFSSIIPQQTKGTYSPSRGLLLLLVVVVGVGGGGDEQLSSAYT